MPKAHRKATNAKGSKALRELERQKRRERQPPPPVICPQCGVDNAGGETNCWNCDEPLTVRHE